MRADDCGWSQAEHLLGTDEGGPTGPAFPTIYSLLTGTAYTLAMSVSVDLGGAP